ncbi:hypothetical protein [Bifidobacterium longum]|uniref:Uncharacterized protein n=2 Tax=Bifidobacterium longum subsp. infantis TaxID=1682 RepID=A0ABM9R4Y0_BIFLI|nr:hypothetical protein [Bifidobacterium longum]ACJ52378.1 hypothetical protein Blon_1290 [Bifidobacterium longum subsp. infantis ATCC 15697 = JCM 1222 = DSM 20088]MBX4249297.1 hypothetical protein [Bifidobacterium longum subsp. infantis]MEE4091700.1 hypothetical protein [Bifidobacterium longum subsp. infantis]CEE98332.1 hypothetical protein BLIC_a01405 [Bifidobacterium longum subsp. infantis]CEF00778.1 hypothetical protein BLIC_b01418 [Bifidobacterium longum subsp. infantis]
MSIETIRPEGPSGEWTVTDRLDYGGTMLRVAERDGHQFVCNGTIPVSEAGPPFVGTLAAELERHPFDVLDRAAGRPIIEAYRARLIARHLFDPLDPDWTHDGHPHLYLIDRTMGVDGLARLPEDRLARMDGHTLTVECFDTDRPVLEFVADGRPVEYVVRRTPWTGRPWTTS